MKPSKNGQSKNGQFPPHLDRNHLPEPEWDFPNANIKMYAIESTPDFPPVKEAPKGSPNILLVLLDDVGFGWPSVNGGLVRMPTAERLAKNGLFYNQFHTTALCSPTRAALLTGRNHHSVATGVIQEMATGYPGYCGIIPKGCATFAEAAQAFGIHVLPGSARTTTCPTTSQVRPGRSTIGQPTKDSTISMALSAGNRPVLSIAPPQYRLRSSLRRVPKRAISSRAISPTNAWAGFASRKRSRPTGRSWLTILARRGARSAPAAARLARPQCGPLRHGVGPVSRDRPREPAEDGRHPGGHAS